MKKVLVILMLFLLGCANKSEKTNKTDNQFAAPTSREDSTRANCYEFVPTSAEDPIYEGYPSFLHILLKKEDNNIYLTKYCCEQDCIEGKIIDEGFVKYHSCDSNGIAIKTKFLGDILINYTCVRCDDKVTWYPTKEAIKGFDTISITLFEDWKIGDSRNICRSSISYFGKVYYSDFSNPEVNDIIQAVTMSSGCSEEMIPFMGYTLEVDSIVDSISSYAVWDIVTLYKKHPLKTCKMKNIEGGTMLQYNNNFQEGDKKLCLTYKNNKLTAINLGGNRAISKTPHLNFVDMAITKRKDGKFIQYTYGD